MYVVLENYARTTLKLGVVLQNDLLNSEIFMPCRACRVAGRPAGISTPARCHIRHFDASMAPYPTFQQRGWHRLDLRPASPVIKSNMADVEYQGLVNEKPAKLSHVIAKAIDNTYRD